MRFIVRMFAVIGLLFIVLVVGAVVAVSRLPVAGRTSVPVASPSVLTLTIAGPFAEDGGRGGFPSIVPSRGRLLREVIDAIDHAGADSRIKGLVVKIDASPGMAQTQELRAALKRFRGAGKFIYAFAADYGGGARGNGEYYLAAATDQVWLQPLGQVALAPLMFEQPFLKDAMGKLDLDPEFVKRSEFKTAPETFTERGYTAAAREMMEALANDLTLQLTGDLAENRKLPTDQIRAAFDRGPLTAEEAVEAKLVDHIGYADELVAIAKAAAGEGARSVPLADYARQIPDPSGNANIALIYEVGAIGGIPGSIDPGADDNARGESAVIQGFAKASADANVKAIVLRVDSPGGSVSGSEAIRRMAVRAKQSGKKLVVSMGATAASGGYWISTDADKIVADPATLTGSIGVFAGKMVIGKTLANIGITTDRTAAPGFAAIDSPFTAYTPEQSQRMNSTLDKIYDAFIARVAEGRKLPAATVAQAAKGRVWTGQQAKQLGLIDEIGGLQDAIRIARGLVGIPAEEAVVKVYPAPQSPLQALRGLVDGKMDLTAMTNAALDGVEGPAGIALRAAAPLFRDPADATVRMPELGPIR